jgi:hypothetical protein
MTNSICNIRNSTLFLEWEENERGKKISSVTVYLLKWVVSKIKLFASMCRGTVSVLSNTIISVS